MPFSGMPVDPVDLFQNGAALEDSPSTWNAHWEERMEQTSKELRHKKTSAYLLTFKEDDLGVSDEVGQLREVLEKLYDFKVYNSLITATGLKAQQQAHRDLADFVYREDAPQGLLIIYFAGHGYSDVRTRPGDMCIAGKLPPPSAEDSAAASNQRLETSRVIWSEIETAIGKTDADVLLILDCCNAGRLGRPLRAPGPAFYELLGACSEDSTTMGPGKKSFTRALTCVLREFAEKGDPFSTSELKAAIMEHVDFPKNQIPILAHRRMPGEHIVIASKQQEARLGSPTQSKADRATELENQEYIDLRFWFKHKVQLDDLDSTADALNKLMRKNVAWERIAFIEKNSIAKKAADKWMSSTWPSGRRSRSGSTPPQILLNGKIVTPGVVNGPSVNVPTTSSGPPTSSLVPFAVHPELNQSELLNDTVPEQSIAYHLGAIVLSLRWLVWTALTKAARLILKQQQNQVSNASDAR